MKKQDRQLSKARNIIPVIAIAVLVVAMILKVCLPDRIDGFSKGDVSDGSEVSQGTQLPDGVTVAPSQWGKEEDESSSENPIPEQEEDFDMGSEAAPDSEPQPKPDPEPQPEPQPESQPEHQPEDEVERDDVGTGAEYSQTWSLILVNPTHSLPDGYDVELATVQGKYQMDVRAADNAKEMIAAAKKDGITLQVCSAYRSHQKQTDNFNAKLQTYLDKGWTYDEAYAKTATIIAVPGTSEHETGLALDIVTPSYQNLDSGYANTDAAKWLLENAADYGFILRFPKDKQDITKIIFEPWHYRYVGTEYSSRIMESGLCLEEWLGQID